MKICERDEDKNLRKKGASTAVSKLNTFVKRLVFAQNEPLRYLKKYAFDPQIEK